MSRTQGAPRVAIADAIRSRSEDVEGAFAHDWRSARLSRRAVPTTVQSPQRTPSSAGTPPGRTSVKNEGMRSGEGDVMSQSFAILVERLASVGNPGVRAERVLSHAERQLGGDTAAAE